MSDIDRQREIFVELADTLVTDFEVAEFCYRVCERCVELLDVEAAGIMLANSSGVLEYLASSNENSELIELFQAQNAEGPCHDAHGTGKPVAVPDLGAAHEGWPGFAPRALELGFRGAHALPMRVHTDVIGSMNLFVSRPDVVVDLDLAQALADMATVGIVNERRLSRATATADQLQRALDSRVVIEQAKGTLAHQAGISVDEAFTRLRAYSRNHNLRIGRVAADVVAGTLTLQDLVPA